MTQVLGPAFVDAAGDTVRTATYVAYLDASQEVSMASGYETLVVRAPSEYPRQSDQY